LIDAYGNTVEKDGVTGELVYEGPNVTLGYAEAVEDLVKDDESGGILFTGDMAKRDIDGYYYITGRKKRFLKIFGNRINLDEVEEMIKDKFSCNNCVCTGYDDNLYVFLTDTTIKESVSEFIFLKFRINKIAFKIEVIDSIPKNEIGKILYNELVTYYDNNNNK
jgi:acyl-coenzyme A synthetase/AMP-(fatty) acid ligase